MVTDVNGYNANGYLPTWCGTRQQTDTRRMSPKKKTVPRKKNVASSTSSSRSRARASGGQAGRFFRALGASALASFLAASCALHPELRDKLSLEPILSRMVWQQDEPGHVTGQAQVQTNFAGCPQFFPERRPPVVPAQPALRELCFSAFAILHGGRQKTPVFVAQRLNRQMLAQGRSIGRTDRFYAEARLPEAERATLADYRGSGYSRGHMAPAGDMHTAEAMAQSFSLANMVPQNQIHNGGAWNRIEQDTRKYVQRAKGDVYIFTGPVYENGVATIGAGHVAVPSHIYKVVYDASSGRAWVHWHANRPDTKAGPPISYEEFVRRTGLELLPPGALR
ncbi:endonuclease G [Kerstersia gyiorum]|uniref:Endonuclease G n=2 Tax=Kerstersia gyiorum TaxID=206506 RepID=A0A4Q7MGC6_9BURK|nr:endonuclease G [Kerstersia gyiorum]